MRGLMSLLWTVSFLTVVPCGRAAGGPPPDPAGWIAFWFPLVGLALGAFSAAVAAGAMALFQSHAVSAVLAVAALVVLTRGLHLDGLADTADGFLGAPERERRLAIMRDSRIGTFGVAAIFFALALKVALTAALLRECWPAAGRSHIGLGALLLAVAALAPAAMAGRWAMILSGAISPYARAEGTGKWFCERMSLRHFLGASAAPALTFLLLFGVRGLVLIGAALLVGLLMTLASWRKVGGATGDTIGAAGELSEVAALAGLLAVVQFSRGAWDDVLFRLPW